VPGEPGGKEVHRLCGEKRVATWVETAQVVFKRTDRGRPPLGVGRRKGNMGAMQPEPFSQNRGLEVKSWTVVYRLPKKIERSGTKV